MIESFLGERERFIKKAIVDKPKIYFTRSPSMLPVVIWSVLWIVSIAVIWLRSDKVAELTTLAKINIYATETQLQVFLTSIMAVIIIAAIHWRKQITYTLTNEYLSVSKGFLKQKTHIVLLDDIANVKKIKGPVGMIGRFSNLLVKRTDGSKILLLAVPNSESQLIIDSKKD
jgi:membrane protein YdbS with pleckstrin-like domain